MNKTDTHDEHAGKGGSYVRENGRRVLVGANSFALTGDGRMNSPLPSAPQAAPPDLQTKSKPNKVKGASNA